MKKYLFFDNASTTKCCDEAADAFRRYSCDQYGNPSSSHAFGQESAAAIRESRIFFAERFGVEPEQVIFTGSGSEADNLAIYGVAMDALAKKRLPFRILASTIEHPAIRATVESLKALGFDTALIPVDRFGQIQPDRYAELLTPQTRLVSIQRVNNIVGALLPVEMLAQEAKKKIPELIFHTDAVQAFGRVDVPRAPSAVDLVSISGHKIEGPKGIGALIVLNKSLLKSGLRPLIWGGGQERGFRAGTQSPGLIAAFRAAAEKTLKARENYTKHVKILRDRLERGLRERNLLGDTVRWNSPENAVPQIVNLSVPGYPSGPLARLLEERDCLVSTGSACSSQKVEPDAVLEAMGLPEAVQTSAIRISFSAGNRLEDVDTLVQALEDSIRLMSKLLA